MPITEAVREQLNTYISDLFAPEDDALRWIQAEAERNGLPTISVQPYEGRLLQLLIYALQARKVVEIGTLAGYSGTWIARALPVDGKLYTLEASSKHAKVARESFSQAGVSDKVELLEGEAQNSLRKLSERAPFDFVFIDANKDGYPAYLAWAVENLRQGGMVAAHNAFRTGRIMNPEGDEDRAMLDFNRSLAEHPQLESGIISVGDGLAVGIKR